MFIILLSLGFAQVYFENLDEEIRYQEDPYYAEYVIEKEKQKRLEEKAREEQKKVRAKQRAEFEKARKDYAEQQKKKKAKEQNHQERAYKKYLEQRKQRKKEQEKARNLYTQKTNQKKYLKNKIRDEQIARMQKELKRLPASIFDKKPRPRVDKEKRKLD